MALTVQLHEPRPPRQNVETNCHKYQKFVALYCFDLNCWSANFNYFVSKFCQFDLSSHGCNNGWPWNCLPIFLSHQTGGVFVVHQSSYCSFVVVNNYQLIYLFQTCMQTVAKCSALVISHPFYGKLARFIALIKLSNWEKLRTSRQFIVVVMTDPFKTKCSFDKFKVTCI